MREWTGVGAHWGNGVFLADGPAWQRWTFVLLNQVNKVEFNQLLVDNLKPGEPEDAFLFATRHIHDGEETLFLPAGRRYVWVTSFLSTEFGKDFAEVLAAQHLPPDWDGDWKGRDIIDTMEEAAS